MENNIKEKKKLYSVAKDRSEAGEPDLYSFMVSKNPKPVSDPIMTTWEIENAAAEIEQQNRTRIDVVINCAQQACVDGCNGVWVKRTLQVLRNNSTVFLFGPTHSAKSFLLEPMFKCFMNPADEKYAWVVLDDCEEAVTRLQIGIATIFPGIKCCY